MNQVTNSIVNTPTITEWITAISGAISALAVIVGLIAAFRQLNSWKNQEKSKARSENAKKVMVAALSIGDVLESVRHPFSSIPKAELKNKYYDFERRLKLLQDNYATFNELRLAQFEARLLAFDSKIDLAIVEFFKIRNEFHNAVWLMSDYLEIKPSSPEELQMLKESREILYATGGDKDSIKKRIDTSTSVLESLLGPIIRLND